MALIFCRISDYVSYVNKSFNFYPLSHCIVILGSLWMGYWWVRLWAFFSVALVSKHLSPWIRQINVCIYLCSGILVFQP